MINNDSGIPGTTLPVAVTAPTTAVLTAPVADSHDIPSPIPTVAKPSVTDWIRSIAKCIIAVLSITVGCLLSILSGHQTLADVSFVQWLWIASYVILAGGLVWKVPNKALS